jgi:nucleotide-binding universal stress UspA family protein
MGEAAARLRDILVPVDFTPVAEKALDFAISLASGEGEILVLHVVDIDFVERVESVGIASRQETLEKLKARAEAKLAALCADRRQQSVQLEPMVVIGKPFAEILRIARDLDFRMIVMGTGTRRRQDIEAWLFGSTAEKVLRATTIPVVFVPS